MSNSTIFDFSAREANKQGAIRQESPLHAISHANAAAPGVRVQELAFRAHLTLRGNPNNADFLSGVEKVLGVALPLTPLSSQANDDIFIFWIGPDEWLILSLSQTASALEASLRGELSGHFSVVDVSSGQTLLALSGAAFSEVLQKSSGYDFEGEFPVGKVISTHFGKASVVLLHKSQGDYLMVVRRSFADYVWRWLVDASAEYGLIVEADSAAK